MTHEDRSKNPGHEAGEARLAGEPSVGVWSRAGELLGRAKRPPEGGGALEDYAYCSVSRGDEERGVRFTLHAFDGGYRVLVEEWGEGRDRACWQAPVDEEEESSVGLFSAEEVKERFPYLLAALEMPDGVEVRGAGA
ncbi:hypothetical protein [Rubrobacter marinus]|uniref:hypothetical protein n=1 Tax=Rubrobacter marinus TaxID=2653852 RepID=UPI001407A48A|nr:hypothetical protein [Rubrobacter marinus]